MSSNYFPDTRYNNMSLKTFSEPYPVSDEKVDFFREHGYVRFDGVLDPEELDAIQDALGYALDHRDGFVRDLAATDGENGENGEGGEGGENGNDKILQMVNLWENFPAIKTYSMNGRLAGMARRLTGSPTVRLFHDQALVKEPGPSAASPWHQDQPYWPVKEPGMISCWMALDDVTIEKGCMQFIAGSHKWGEFAPMSFTGDGPKLEDILSDEQKAVWNPIPIELKAGDCTWHHGWTWHFTNPNSTNEIRRAMVTIYIP
ncbi:MAG: phytanoyl-CoA dioxygenase family protein, partial [Rhodothermia bacterium]